MRRTVAARSSATVLAASLLLLALPGTVAAHAELVTSTPADGATVQGTPLQIVGTYSEAMDPAASSLKLESPDGTTVASGGVDRTDNQRMAITNVPDLAPGTYTVKSTTKSAADGDIDHRTWTFTVEAAAATATASTSASASATPNATPIATDNGLFPPSTAASSPSPAPSASADGGTPTGSGGDVVLPIVGAVAILAVAAIWFSRRGRTSPGG